MRTPSPVGVSWEWVSQVTAAFHSYFLSSVFCLRYVNANQNDAFQIFPTMTARDPYNFNENPESRKTFYSIKMFVAPKEDVRMTRSRDRCKLISVKPEYLSHQVLNLQGSPFCLKSNLILCYFCQSYKSSLLCDLIILFCGIKSESFSVHNIWDQILLFQQLDKSLKVFRSKLLHQSKIRKSTLKVILNIKRKNL